jgi:hypothetical protein
MELCEDPFEFLEGFDDNDCDEPYSLLELIVCLELDN